MSSERKRRTRLCRDCAADITERHGNAVRCGWCAVQARKRWKVLYQNTRYRTDEDFRKRTNERARIRHVQEREAARRLRRRLEELHKHLGEKAGEVTEEERRQNYWATAYSDLCINIRSQLRQALEGPE